MMKKKWDNKGVSLYPLAALSDCQISHMVIEEKEIEIFFDEGIVVCDKETEEYAQSGTAKIVFKIEQESMKLYKDPYGQNNYPNRSLLAISIDDLQNKINKKIIQCTVVEEYYSINSAILKLFYNEKGDRGWLYMQIDFNQVQYYWDDAEVIDGEK